MADDTQDQDSKNWKQQYYNQLDTFDLKNKEWQEQETILKKTVLRLSIAAEGQNATIDRHLQDIRSVVKKQINVIRLESSLEEISAVLLKLGDKNNVTDRKLVATLHKMLESLELPNKQSKQKAKLLKKLSKANDKASDALSHELYELLSTSITTATDNIDVVSINVEEKSAPKKTSLLKTIFGSRDARQETVEEKTPDQSEVKNTTTKTLAPDKKKNIREGESESIHSGSRSETSFRHAAVERASKHSSLNEAQTEPSPQDILIRLLELLSVPADLQGVVNDLKQRIKDKKDQTDWKGLLTDIAQLINTLRSQMQEEKQEFEVFLQQITGRLQEMDGFLSSENTALIEAEQAGGVFDAAVSAQVQDIHADMSSANNLDDLKHKVEKRLNVVSEHIKEYRETEQERFSDAQQNVENMQSRLQLLEQESGDLRQLIVEKSKEAMMDVLTEVPNRLAYEKKALEEIARCNRFPEPLSMAVWDIDLFKQVNDGYGHKVGDKVLKAVAQLLHARMRETDFIARYGGEEFVMFLPGANEAMAVELADTLREKIAACNFKHQGGIVRITVSCGITSFQKGDNHETMFERADKALYAAKDAGRNLCLASSSLCK